MKCGGERNRRGGKENGDKEMQGYRGVEEVREGAWVRGWEAGVGEASRRKMRE